MKRSAAVQVWSHTFSDALPPILKEQSVRKIDELGSRLDEVSHQRWKGRPEFKLRIGDYRVLSEFDLTQGKLFLHYLGHRREIYKRP